MAEVVPGDIHDKFLTARRYHRPPLSQEQLGEALGISHTMISRFENGSRAPTLPTVEKLARLLRLPVDWFYDGRPGPPPFMPETMTSAQPGSAPPAPSNVAHLVAEAGVGRRQYPVVGSAAGASFPHQSEDPWPGDFVEFSDDLYRPERFAIQLKGDSMYPRIEHGDYILVQPAMEVERGLMVVAKNGDYEYTVKIYDIADGRVVLRPINPSFSPIIPGDGWQIVGYAVGLRRERGRGRYLEEGDNAGLRP